MIDKPTVISIVGLEHSGTTLLDTILSCQKGAVGLGEAQQVLDDDFRQRYFARWGSFDDADMCSCGKRHRDCPVWGTVMADIENNSDGTVEERYAALIGQLGRYDYLIDSSKSLGALDIHLAALSEGLVKDVRILWIYKDPRSFAASQLRKGGADLLAIYRCLNWWTGAQKSIMQALDKLGDRVAIVSYEQLCFDTRGALTAIEAFLGFEFDDAVKAGIISGTKNSHIAIGNKDMLNRSNTHVRYDGRWIGDYRIQAAFLLHRGAKRLLAQINDLRETGTMNYRGMA